MKLKKMKLGNSLRSLESVFKKKIQNNVHVPANPFDVDILHNGREVSQHDKSIASLDHLGKLFDQADEDTSGLIGRDEFRNLAHDLIDLDLHGGKESIDELFDRIDADGSGEIDFDELRTWLESQSSATSIDAHAEGHHPGRTTTALSTKGFSSFPVKDGFVRVSDNGYLSQSERFWMSLSGEDEILRFYSPYAPDGNDEGEQEIREPVSLHHDHSNITVTENDNELRLVFPTIESEYILIFKTFKSKQDWWVTFRQVQNCTKRLKKKPSVILKKPDPSIFWICNGWFQPRSLVIERKVTQQVIGRSTVLPGFDIVRDEKGVESIQPHFWSVARVAYERVVGIIIRPPRNHYELKDLGPRTFTFMGQSYVRNEFELENPRGMKIRCSQWMSIRDDLDNRTLLIYLHGNASCRKEALHHLSILFSLGIDVVTLDTSGSGLSDGEYVSLGYYEQTDVLLLMKHLRALKKAAKIAIWGRSMGASTSLLYAGGADNGKVGLSAVIADSPFSSMDRLARDYVNKAIKAGDDDTLKGVIRDQAISMVNDDVFYRANFRMEKCAPLEVAKNIEEPTLLIHAEKDTTINISHSKAIFAALHCNEKQIITEGPSKHNPGPIGHNTVRSVQTFSVVASFLCNHLDLLDKNQSKNQLPIRFQKALKKVMFVQSLNSRTFFRKFESMEVDSAPIDIKNNWASHKKRFFENIWTFPPWILDWFFESSNILTSKSNQKKMAIDIGQRLMGGYINNCTSGMTEERNQEVQSAVSNMMNV